MQSLTDSDRSPKPTGKYLLAQKTVVRRIT
jgi:hypothetical protein